MKAWQGGYPLEDLLALERLYKHYNTFSFSPFSAMKKHRFAEPLLSKELQVDYDDEGPRWAYLTEIATRPSFLFAYPDVKIGEKRSGDRIVKAWAWRDQRARSDMLARIQSYQERLWLQTWAEDRESQEAAELLFATPISTVKVSSFAELTKFWTLNGALSCDVPDYEHWAYGQFVLLDINHLLDKVAEQLSRLPAFADHYSKYNERHSWSALSLRGYSSDPKMIEKPAEMSKAWKGEHPEWQSMQLIDTPLLALIPAVSQLVSCLPTPAVQRIRFMALAPNGGALRRHSDLVDVESGLADGKIARLHFPIQTNPQVLFQSWGHRANIIKLHMSRGSGYYLDTRKPHAANNGGSERRIHLVIDVQSCADIRALLRQGVVWF